MRASEKCDKYQYSPHLKRDSLDCDNQSQKRKRKLPHRYLAESQSDDGGQSISLIEKLQVQTVQKKNKKMPIQNKKYSFPKPPPGHKLFNLKCFLFSMIFII